MVEAGVTPAEALEFLDDLVADVDGPVVAGRAVLPQGDRLVTHPISRVMLPPIFVVALRSAVLAVRTPWS